MKIENKGLFKKMSEIVKKLRVSLRLVFLIIFFLWMVGRYEKAPDYKSLMKEIEVKGLYENGKELEITHLEDKIFGLIEKKAKLRHNEINRDGIRDASLAIRKIEELLEKHNLRITDLEEEDNSLAYIYKDPMRLFIIKPLDKLISYFNIRKLGKEKNGYYLIFEIIIKLVAIKIIYYTLIYNGALEKFQEKIKFTQEDSELSIEEKNGMLLESIGLLKQSFFNSIIFVLFNISLVYFHPFFIDRSSEWYLKITRYYWLIIPFVIFNIFSFILGLIREMIVRRKILNLTELKDYLKEDFKKILANFFLFFLTLFLNRGSKLGFQIVSFCNSAIDNLIELFFFGFSKRKKRV